MPAWRTIKYPARRGKSERIVVRATYDAEAKGWWTASSDLPGLNLWGDSLEHLREQIPGAVIDLLEVKGLRLSRRARLEDW